MFKCKYCGKEFESKQKLGGHVTQCEANPNSKRENSRKNILKAHQKQAQPNQTYTCKWCGKILTTSKSGITFHENRCEKNPNRKIHPGNQGHTAGYTAWNKGLTMLTHSSIKAGAEKLKARYENGTLTPAFLGRKHTDETKRKLRLKAKECIETLHGSVRCRYSKKGCKLMNELNEKNSWHLQHAENGGEFFVDGYWVDGYDKQNNIVFEYDEPQHYKDVVNNILRDKDIERQQNIIKALGCTFYRYNEYLDKLYVVGPIG